jgi:hypothetical protein
MTYVPVTPSLGFAPIASTKAALTTMFAGGRSPGPELGDIIRAVDPVYGVGEFIYLLGVASTVVGSLVTWSGGLGAPTFQTALAPSTAGLAQPLAVAMSINLATFYGWYQITGNAVIATNGTLATGPGPVYLAGSGQVTSTQANGKQVLNAQNVSATGTPSTGLAVVYIDRPFAQGQVV